MPKAFVLAAGLGSRIRAVAGDLPKPLIRFGGEPILAHNLRWLAGAGVREVFINLHYRAEMIRDAVGDGARFGLRVDYFFEPELLGTAGALRNLGERFDDTLLLVYGDNIVRLDLAALLARHRAAAAKATVALFDPQRHANTGIAGGRVHVGDRGEVAAFVEGGPGTNGGLVNAGVYALEPAIRPYLGAEGSIDFGRDVFPAMLAAREPLAAHEMPAEGFCLGLDTPESYAEGERLLAAGRLALA